MRKRNKWLGKLTAWLLCACMLAGGLPLTGTAAEAEHAYTENENTEKPEESNISVEDMSDPETGTDQEDPAPEPDEPQDGTDAGETPADPSEDDPLVDREDAGDTPETPDEDGPDAQFDELDPLTDGQAGDEITECTIDGVVYQLFVQSPRTCRAIGYTDDIPADLTIPASITVDNKTYTVTEIEKAYGTGVFEGCDTLKTVTIENGLTTIGKNAFYGCRQLTTAVIPDSVTQIRNYAFAGCTALTSVTLPASLTYDKYSPYKGTGMFQDDTALVSVRIPDTWTEIYNSMFAGCTLLENVSMPDGITRIGDGAFNDCRSLKSITLPSGLKTIGASAFGHCALETLSIPNQVELIERLAFGTCESITSVTFPNSVETIEDFAFSDCSDLASVTFGTGIKAIGAGAFGNTALTSVTIPDSVTDFGLSYVYKDTPSLITNEGAVFAGCESLSSVTIGSGVTELGKNTFYECEALTGFTLPETVTVLGEKFLAESGVTTITIPNAGITIDPLAFKNARQLTDIYFSGSTTQWKAKGVVLSASNGNRNDLLVHYGAGQTAPTAITINAETAMTIGETQQLSCSATPENACVDAYTDIIWSIDGSSTGLAKLNDRGVITAIRAGDIIINAVSELDHTVTATVTITVTGGNQSAVVPNADGSYELISERYDLNLSFAPLFNKMQVVLQLACVDGYQRGIEYDNPWYDPNNSASDPKWMGEHIWQILFMEDNQKDNSFSNSRGEMKARIALRETGTEEWTLLDYDSNNYPWIYNWTCEADPTKEYEYKVVLFENTTGEVVFNSAGSEIKAPRALDYEDVRNNIRYSIAEGGTLLHAKVEYKAITDIVFHCVDTKTGEELGGSSYSTDGKESVDWVSETLYYPVLPGHTYELWAEEDTAIGVTPRMLGQKQTVTTSDIVPFEAGDPQVKFVTEKKAVILVKLCSYNGIYSEWDDFYVDWDNNYTYFKSTSFYPGATYTNNRGKECDARYEGRLTDWNEYSSYPTSWQTDDDYKLTQLNVKPDGTIRQECTWSYNTDANSIDHKDYPILVITMDDLTPGTEYTVPVWIQEARTQYKKYLKSGTFKTRDSHISEEDLNFIVNSTVRDDNSAVINYRVNFKDENHSDDDKYMTYDVNLYLKNRERWPYPLNSEFEYTGALNDTISNAIEGKVSPGETYELEFLINGVKYTKEITIPENPTISPEITSLTPTLFGAKLTASLVGTSIANRTAAAYKVRASVYHEDNSSSMLYFDDTGTDEVTLNKDNNYTGTWNLIGDDIGAGGHFLIGLQFYNVDNSNLVWQMLQRVETPSLALTISGSQVSTSTEKLTWKISDACAGDRGNGGYANLYYRVKGTDKWQSYYSQNSEGAWNGKVYIPASGEKTIRFGANINNEYKLRPGNTYEVQICSPATEKKYVYDDKTYEFWYEDVANEVIYGTFEFAMKQPPTSIRVTPATAKVKLGQTLQLRYSVTPEDACADVTWWGGYASTGSGSGSSSSSEQIFRVTDTGLVIPIKEGTATAYVRSALDSSIEGTCKITVEKGSGSAPVKTLTASKTKTVYNCGETISISDLTVEYSDGTGTPATVVTDYTTNLDELNASMDVPGKKTLTIRYTADGTELTAEVSIKVVGILNETNVTVSMDKTEFLYTSYAIRPEVTVTWNASDTALLKGTDYVIAYDTDTNVNAGTSTIRISAAGGDDCCYSGSITKSFTIKPVPLTITADSLTVSAGKTKDDGFLDGIGYTADGLKGMDLLADAAAGGDGRLTADQKLYIKLTDSNGDVPVRNADGMYAAGQYKLIPSGANAGDNYVITYTAGTLYVSEEGIAYTVRFNMLGHGTAPDSVGNVKAGSTIDKPASPADDQLVDGWIFKGWYRDAQCTKAWDFKTDLVQEDTVLYARWVENVSGTGLQLCVQEILDQEYTGSAVKPVVAVFSTDGETLLKANTDYSVKYYNNIHADVSTASGGTTSDIHAGTGGFDSTLPYIEIKGKGNYAGTVYKNFHILRKVISDAAGEPADGIVLKYADQLTASNSLQKPFSSIKYGKKSMTAGTDFTLSLTGPAGAVDATNANAPAIGKGCSGTFTLTITGKGDYSGTIVKTVEVKETKAGLIKNAQIKLGSNLKSVAYTGSAIELSSGWLEAGSYKTAGGQVENDKSIFTVKASDGKYLKEGTDYTVSYENNQAVGTATMTITGIGNYTGSKSVTFKITGLSFSAGNFEIDLKDETFTGNPITQNDAAVKIKKEGLKLAGKDLAKGTALSYGEDYVISYKNNIKKGSASVTFTALPASGWTGSFTKKFKINAAAITDIAAVTYYDVDNVAHNASLTGGSCTLPVTAEYTAAGAVLTDDLVRIANANTGLPLTAGSDYSQSYKNNKVIGSDTAVMTIKGKGNYSGELKLTYSVGAGDIKKASASAAAVDFNSARTNTYEPKLTVKDGKTSLKAGKDYEIQYKNNSKADVASYLNELENPTGASVQAPYALVTGKGNYQGTTSVPLSIYKYKMTAGNLYIVYDAADCIYTGSQLTPGVTVYYGKDADIKAIKRVNTSGAVLTEEQKQQYNLKELTLSGDYTVSYGANDKAGKNKGVITVTGAGLYGGSVTQKFEIISKKVYK